MFVIHAASAWVLQSSSPRATLGALVAPHACESRRPCIVACADGAAETMVRLDKLLAERGAGSRKDVDRMIRS